MDSEQRADSASNLWQELNLGDLLEEVKDTNRQNANLGRNHKVLLPFPSNSYLNYRISCNNRPEIRLLVIKRSCLILHTML
jgi:hypothetical protein